MADRKGDYKAGGVVDPAEAAERRRVETAAITAHRRDSALRSKRLRRESSRQSLGASRGPSRDPSMQSLGGEDLEGGGEEEPMALETPEEIAQLVAAAVEKLRGAKPVGSKGHCEAVRELRRLLSNYEDPPYQEALAAGAVPLLVTALQPPRVDGTALEAIFEAAWALTNLAVGQHEVVKAVLPAAPILIAYLGGGSGAAVAEQCAWALGNIAAEDLEFRETLIANGAIRPLTQLMMRAEKALNNSAAPVDDDDPVLAAATTAAWALSNILRGAGPEVGELIGVEGAPQCLVALMSRAPDHVATEVSWVLAYVTAANEAYLNRLVNLGVVKPLVDRLVAIIEQSVQEEPQGRSLLIPLLRTLGNIAAGGGSTACAQLLSPESAAGVQAVVTCAQGRHHGLQKEAAWVLSNLAGAPGRDGVEALKRAGAVPVLMLLLKDAPFHVRKEAGYAIANICAGGGGGNGDLEALNWLFAADRDALKAMVSLMRSADMDAAKLGLQFTEMVLRMLSNGAEAVESVDGIDAMEAVQFGIGLACAEALGGAGANILITDINEKSLRAAEVHLQQLLGPPSVGSCVCDVGNKASVQAMVQAAVQCFGGLDIMVCNAAVLRTADFLEMEEEEWDDVLRVNLKGVFLAGQAAARQMVEQNKSTPGRGGAIINMSSVNSYVAIPTIPNYCASKGGINSLTRAMSISLAPHGIRVNAVAPGSIATEMLEHVRADRESWRRVLSRTPMLRAGLPSEAANVVKFLASTDSGYITGQVIVVDGGRMALNYTVEVPEDS